MISLIDGETQYFLAGAELDGKSMGGHADWFGCSNIPMHQSLCQYTITADESPSEYPCLVVEDLLEDERFCHLPVVNGSVAAYRFYAGTAISTSRGVKIGSFFVLDNNPRPEGLTLGQRKVMCTSAASVMKHLEMRREATERRRVSLMSQGIARFLESKSHKDDQDMVDQEHKTGVSWDAEPVHNGKRSAPADSGSSGRGSAAKTEDPVRRTFKSAASILLESLEIESGGVMFLDTAVSFSEAGYTDAYSDTNTSLGQNMEAMDGNDERPVFRHNRELSQGALLSSISDSHNGQTGSSVNRNPAAEIMAMATSTEHQPAQPANKVLDCKTLQALLNMYPEGNVWYFDEGGYFSSLEQVTQCELRDKSDKSNRRRLDVKKRISEEIAEATMLRERFEKARQIIFLPMWDAATKRWYAGCLVWSHSAVPVFTVDSEIAYLAAFTNSVTVEISCLDAIRADQAKADFISSISHEFRSPLHGILASTEFLQELTTDETQSELISTVQSCGRTLLETINHVLDFSKINSFEKSKLTSREGGLLLNELHSVTNIAVLCEEVVDGMIVAKSFDDISSSGDSTAGSRSVSQATKASEKLVEVVLDFDKQNWQFFTQPGALRRIVMNIFGNAQKYTDEGFIQVSLRPGDPVMACARGAKGMSSGKSVVSLIIKDSGRGISKEYLQHRLYTPFAQDDTFASGVGLGLSIVWSIVQQLGGIMAVHSLQGKGTEVEICLPVEEADHWHGTHTPEPSLENPQDADSTLNALRELATKNTIALLRPDSPRGQDMILDRVEHYLSNWYGFSVSKFTDWAIVPKAEVVIALEAYEPSTTLALPRLGNQYIPTLLLNGTLASKDRKRYPAEMAVGHVTRPVGPYKLARHLLSIIQTHTVTVIQDPTEFLPFGGNENYNHRPKKQPTDLPVIPGPQQPAAKGPEGDLVQRFNLMNVRNSDATSSTEKTAQEPKPKGGLRILAVDDNEINLQLLQRFLSKRKDDIVDGARDGFEAVAAVHKAAKPYDVVFMDISMPGMDGFEATRKIRQYETGQAAKREADNEPHPRSYIVALTGLGASRDREEATRCGFDDYLTKPIPFQKVGQLLKERKSK